MRPLREEIRKKGFEAVKGGEEVRPILPLSPLTPRLARSFDAFKIKD